MSEKEGALVKWLLISFFILIQMLVILRNISIKDYSAFFWFCDFAPLFLAIAFYFKNDQLVKGIINVGLLAQILSVFLFLIFVLSGLDIAKISQTFVHTLPQGGLFLLLHLTIPIALFFQCKKKPTRISLAYSFTVLVLLFLLSVFFTIPIQNINTIYSSTILVGFTPPYYTPLWVFLTFICIVVPTYYIQKEIYALATHKSWRS